MGIEGGSIGTVGAGVSVGPSINIGSSVSVGTEVGLSARFGPSITGLSSPIVSEGPAGRSFLENTMPLQLGFNQVEEIKFNDKPFTGNTSPEPLLPQDEIKAVEAAEDIVAQAQQPLEEADVVAGVEDWLGIGNTVPDVTSIPSSVIPAEAGIYTNNHLWIRPRAGGDQVGDDRNEKSMMLQANPVIVPGPVEAASPTIFNTVVEQNVGIQTRLQSDTENRTAVKTAPAVAIQPVLQEQAAEVEELVEEQSTPEKPVESLEGKETREKILYLEDVEVSKERRREIREAIIKAGVEAGRLGLKKIAGWLVAKFMPLEHAGNRSQVVKKSGPDGSYQETVEGIAAAGELESEAAAIKRFDKIVAEKKPVKCGKEGIPVANKDVARVFKYKFFKPAQPYAEVIRRVVRKSITPARQSAGTIPPGSHLDSRPHFVQDPQGWMVVEQEEIKPEGSLEGYPVLAEACLVGRQVQKQQLDSS